MEQNLIPLLLLLQPVLRAGGQYQLVREDPFAQLSSTLQTWQSAACDGEFTHLRCPEGSKISIQFVQYDRSSNLSICPGDLYRPDPPVPGQDCRVRDSVRQVEDLCQGQEICSVQTGFALLGGSRGDRCPRVRRHLEILYKCKPASFRSRVECGGDALNLSCSKSTQRLAIMSAAFASASAGHVYCPLQNYQQDGVPGVPGVPGYKQDGVPGYQYSTPPTQDLLKCEKTSVTSQIVSACHGQKDCSLLADPHILGVPECHDLHVFMKTTFACVDLSVFLPRFLLNSTQRDRYDSTSSTEKSTTTLTTTKTSTTSTTTVSTTTTTTESTFSEMNTITVKTPKMDYFYESNPGSETTPGSGRSIGEEYWWNRGEEQGDSHYKGDRIYLDDKNRDESMRDMTQSGPVIVLKDDEDSSGLLKLTSSVLTNLSYLKEHKIEVVICFILAAALGTVTFLIAYLIRFFRARSLSPRLPSTTDLDTVDCDPDMEIIPTPLPEPQFLSSHEPRYSTLGRGNKVLRNSHTDYSTPSPARDNVVRYSTIGRQRTSPNGVPAASSPQPIYAPGSTYSSGGVSNHSSFLDSDPVNPRSLTLSHRSDFSPYE